MKVKIKLLALIIFFVVCIGFLPVIAIPLPYQGLDWLSLGAAMAQCGCIEKESPPQPPDQVEPGQARSGVVDPQTPDIRVDFLPASVSEPVEVKAYFTELPAGVPPPAESVIGSPFLFGAWVRGQGRTVQEFDPSIVLNVRYDESAFAQASVKQQPVQLPASFAFAHLDQSITEPPLAFVTLPALALFSSFEPEFSQANYIPLAQEQNLKLSMYDPTTQGWVKLCNRSDGYANVVSGAVALLTPLEANGNALFAVTLDNTPALNQVVDALGNTTLSLPESNTRFNISPGIVEVGTYFEVTLLASALNSNLIRLLPTPADIKACQADYATANAVHQITQFPKPVKVEFDYDVDTLARAGGQANLTIVTLQNAQWVDMDELGYRVVRDESKLSVETDELGPFSIAVK